MPATWLAVRVRWNWHRSLLTKASICTVEPASLPLTYGTPSTVTLNLWVYGVVRLPGAESLNVCMEVAVSSVALWGVPPSGVMITVSGATFVFVTTSVAGSPTNTSWSPSLLPDRSSPASPSSAHVWLGLPVAASARKPGTEMNAQTRAAIRATRMSRPGPEKGCVTATAPPNRSQCQCCNYGRTGRIGSLVRDISHAMSRGAVAWFLAVITLGNRLGCRT